MHRSHNRRTSWTIPGGMNTCPVLTALWITGLARAELPDYLTHLAFRLLDGTPHRA